MKREERGQAAFSGQGRLECRETVEIGDEYLDGLSEDKEKEKRDA